MPQLEIEVCRAAQADAEILSRFSAALFPLGCLANTSREDLAAFIETELTPDRFRAFLADEEVVILMLKASNAIAGFAMITRTAAPASLGSQASFELKKFYIDPTYHGKGAAGILMQEALAVVGHDSGESIWLSVYSENQRAVAFYEKSGFRIAGTQNFLVGNDPQKDYLMLREKSGNTTGVS